jgi:phosphate transport system ATP-binding protein
MSPADSGRARRKAAAPTQRAPVPAAESQAARGATESPVKIAVRGLDFFYGDFQALKGVELEIRAQTITALIGPSGCGKTTFLRALNRMNDSIRGARASGQVLIDDEDIYAPGTDVVALRQRVGMVFQRPNPFPQSVFDNVAFGPIVLGLARGTGDLEARVEHSLKEVGLWEEVKDALDGPAQALNPGQQQRLCIARAVATSPEIILMDEPCSALDPVATLRIETLMRQLAREYTIVVVTHNMQQAARVSQWTGFFWLGELIEFNVTAQIFTRPAVPLTEDYITGRRG